MNLFLKIIPPLHSFFYRLTGGRLGGKMGGNEIALVHNVGAKSGKKYITPLVYFRDGSNYVIIASAGGAPRNPGWYHNLRKNPETVIQVMGEKINVRAEEAPPKKRDRLWKRITQSATQFREYQAKTERTIPLFILRPQ